MKLIDIYTLSNIKGLGDKSIIKIIDFCRVNNIANLYELKDNNILNGLQKSTAEKLGVLFENLDTAIKNNQWEIDSFEKDGVIAIAITEDAYPQLLKESQNPPAILFCRGNIKLLNSEMIAVIGTRESTAIGNKITEKTTSFLVENNFTIVSGLALGIDAIAHKQTISKNGRTIAVLASVDDIQPAQNRQLASEIVARGGLLISEQKPKIKFHSGQLVKRDRIQSGLSKFIFVIETKVDGGSMHAVNDAIKHGKTVYSPNISSFDDKYKAHVQTQGILKLQKEKLSIPFDSKDYEMLSVKLKAKSFGKSLKEDRLF